MTCLERKSLKLNIKKIKLVITDIDGVLTDGKLFYLKGKIYRTFNIKDGTGFQLLKMAGIKILVISAKKSEEAKERFSELGVDCYIDGVNDKFKTAEEFIRSNGLKWDEVCYIGDDLQDIPLIKKAGLSVTPSDGCKEVKELAHYICKKKGGEGVLREIAELILKEKKIWESTLGKFLASL